MMDPTVTSPEELAFHVSGYAARLADALEGNLPSLGGRSAATYPAPEAGMTLKHLAQGLEYVRLSALATATAPAVQGDDKAELLVLAAELETLWRRLDAVGTRIATAQPH
ncbi:hypothetical protein ACFY05_32580 [Microtetraspora fusca]|uniref:Uncharacterized protein n=1 Tax=Microtetraspora fusca TaxID=1997 RepID=A0ABW6VE22_MICFU